jgi:hypothetical protein
MGIGGRLRQAYIASKMLGMAGRAGRNVRSGIGGVREIGGNVVNRFRRGRLSEEQFEQRNATRIEINARKKEQKRILEQMLDSIGIHGFSARLRARRDKRLQKMAEVIHSIFGNNITAAELNAVNVILRRQLNPNSPMLNSPQGKSLKLAIEILSKGKPKTKVDAATNVLRQASMDILQKDEMGQQILQSKGLM